MGAVIVVFDRTGSYGQPRLRSSSGKKGFADGDVHKYFNPYQSPYDSYINYMNILDSIRGRLA